MGTLWIPGAEKLPCSKPGGTITSSAPPRAVWHTTEAQPGTAAVWSAMIRVLNNKSAEPQVLYDPVTDRLGQFMPLNLSGRALKNDGATQTNRVGKVCIQIEVIAYSSKPFTAYWKPGKNFKALIAALRSWGIPVDVWPAGAPPKFIDSPPHNVPENDRDRKTWLTKGGYFSHSQIPANDHGDPGGISITSLAAAGKAAVAPKPPVPEDDMQFTDPVPGLTDPDGTPVTVGEALIRGLYGYKVTTDGGWISTGVQKHEFTLYGENGVIDILGTLDQRIKALVANEALDDADVDAVKVALEALKAKVAEMEQTR